jgi:hypothetical protein
MRPGTTTFSFTNEWLTRRFTRAELLERAAACELGPGLEVVGHQLWRDYPNLDGDEILDFRRLCERLGFEPAAIGGYVDLLRRPDRVLSVDEAAAELEAQIVTAAGLGFGLVRLHAGIPVDALERVASSAERSGVVLATEVQGGQAPDDPAVEAILECRERLGSVIALVLDFSVSMTAVPASFADAVRRAGMPADELADIVSLWEGGAPTGEVLAAITEAAAPNAAQDEARAGFFRFGRQTPEAWLPFVPFVAHAHAKFWELDETGDEPTVDNAALLRVLRDGGFDGVIASEWGGSAWVDVDDVDAFELVRRHQVLLAGLLAAPAESLTS